MPNLTTQSLANKELTRADILRVCEKYRHDKPFLRKVLRGIFKRPENIHLFGWFISKEYIELETPDFHRQILREISSGNSRVAICAPRGHAKSTIVNFTYALWATVQKKVRFGLIISDTVTQSVEFVNALRDEIDSNIRLRWLYGDLTGELWRDGDIKTASGVRWTAKGAGMKIRGIRDGSARPDLIIFDDLENDEQVATAYQRKKLKDWFRKAAMPALSRKGRIIMIGTILHYDSLLQNILDGKEGFRSWRTMLFSAIMKDEKGREFALWSEHMNLEELKALRDDPNHPKYVGSIVFAQEYQNKPLSEDDLIVKPENIKWIDELPENTVIRRTVLAIDPAVSQRDTADPTAKVVASLDQFGNVFVRYVGNDRFSVSENGADIQRLNARFSPERIGIEEGALGLVFKDLLAGLPLVGLKANADKTSRLISVSRFFESGKIYFLQNANKIQDLHDQLMEFPNGAHDDMVDAMVYAIRMLLVEGQKLVSAEDFVLS